MNPLATPDWREIASIETPSQPFSRNKRKAVASRLRCRRSASSRVGRPPGPRLNSVGSSGASDITFSLPCFVPLSTCDRNGNATIPFGYKRSRAVNRRSVAAIIIFLLLAAAGAGWWWKTRVPPPVQWQGYAEADFIKVGPTQQGLLTSLYVARGSKVEAGAPLFDQDDVNDIAARDQTARQLKQAEEQLANLEAGGKPTEIQQAEANLADAHATRDKLQSDLKRNEELVKNGGVSKQLVEDQRADLRSALAKVQGLEAAVAQMRAPIGREGEIKAQRQLVESLRAAVTMAQWRIDQRHVKAPAAGIVADVLARPGETIPAGGPVVSLLPPDNIFVRFFVPEPRLAEVHVGDKVTLKCDRCAADLAATVSFISPQAEFTPPVIYSEASRAKLVYMVEARPPRERAILINPGQPMAVRPLPAPPIARNAPESAFR